MQRELNVHCWDHSAQQRLRYSGDETVQRGRKTATPEVGQQLARSLVSLLALRVCLSGGLPLSSLHLYLKQWLGAILKVLAPPTDALRPQGQVVSLAGFSLQDSAPSSRKDPALEREEGEGSPRPTCGLRSPSLGFLHSPTPAPGLQVSQARQLDRDSRV